MKRKFLFVFAIIALTLTSCTWEETLAWDKIHGLNPGTTNHALYETTGINHHDPSHVDEEPTVSSSASSSGWTVWDDLAECESHGEWDYGPHSTWGSKIYHGGLQFHPNTWTSHKLPGYPQYAYQATREQQIEVGKRVQAAQGWGAWPDCSRKLGLR